MPKCFISYSWDNEDHKQWVKSLATSLRNDGVETILDQWHLDLGDQLPFFMEKSISENDFVLIICTQRYKTKSDNRQGGVGYEGDIITSELFTNRNLKKFIPILREGTWTMALPNWLGARLGVDLSNEPYSPQEYRDLLATLRNRKEKAPPIGKPNYEPHHYVLNEDVSASIKPDYEDTKIIGILVDEVTVPKNDGTRGSALYKIPFKLNHAPTYDWTKIFVEKWNRPSQFTSMHRPGIASVSHDKIILNGTTIDEVKQYHRDTLILAVTEANKIEKELIRRKNLEDERRQKEVNTHRNHIVSIADDIFFD